MIKAKTGIKLLRRLGIVLITMPEVITTPFGIALLLTARYLSQKLEAIMYKRLRETLKLYLDLSKPLSDGAEDESKPQKRAKRSTKRVDRVIPWQQKDSRSFGTELVPLILPDWRNTTDDTVRHSVDMNWLSRRYGTIEGLKVEPGDSNLETTPDGADNLTHHSIDMQILSRRFKADDNSKVEADSSDTSVSAEEVIHHTINSEALSRRFKEKDSSEPDSDSANTSDTEKEAVHHPLNRKLVSQRYDTAATLEKTSHHTINMASLLRRYGSAVGFAPAPKTT